MMPEVAKMMEADFSEWKHEEKVMSQDDLKFIQVIQQGIKQDADSYYVMPLPFRDGKPDNRAMAQKRFDHLKRWFK